MNVVICTDIEGVGGVVSFEDQAFADGKGYRQAKSLLTAEVNAAAEGMIEAGAEEILVIDGHGAGGICFEELRSGVRLLHGRVAGGWGCLAELCGRHDAAAMVGQHAMAGAERGSLCHTQDHQGIEYYRLNGRPIGEIAQWALFCGAAGVPTVFLSGDDAACREAEALIPGITTAAVKEGICRTAAISLAAPDAHQRIRSSARAAIRAQREKPIGPLIWDGPFVLEKRFTRVESADAACANPLCRRVDERTVQLCSDDLLEIIYA